MDPASAKSDVAAAAAATWYARLHADDATPADRAAFGSWLAVDDAHDHAWQNLVSATRILDEARDDPALLAMIGATRSEARASPWQRWLPMAAAAVVLTIGGSAALVVDRHATPPATQTAAVRYATPIGQLRDVMLSDGTLMTLDAESAVRVSAPGTERRVAIDRGQAFFKVAHDARRPFVVSVDGNSVTALGTQFAVRTAADGVIVSLVEGSVRVDAPAFGRAMTLAAGNTLTIGTSGLQLTRTGAGTTTGWRKGELTFDATPLKEVIAELNRYTVQRIELRDAQLATRVFSGVLKTDGGGPALADALTAYGVARVTYVDRTRLVLASQP